LSALTMIVFSIDRGWWIRISPQGVETHLQAI